MLALLLDPDEAREALDPKKYPKRHVFLVSVEGDIICCDLDEGWIRITKPPEIQNLEWCAVLKAAISHMQHYTILAKLIHDNLRETSEAVPKPQPSVMVFEKGNCPVCTLIADPEFYPYCSEAHRIRDRGF